MKSRTIVCSLALSLFAAGTAHAQGDETARPAEPTDERPAATPTSPPATEPAPAPVPPAPAPVEPGPPPAEPTAAPAQPANAPEKIVLRAPDASVDQNTQQEGKEDEPHEGAFANFDLGLGYGAVIGGSMSGAPGFRPIDDLSFSGPVFASSAQVGAGFENFALAGELLWEVMITEKEEPDNVGFQMFGIGLAAAYYMDDDYFIGAQLRYLGMILWREGIPCFWDRGASAGGPGVGVTLGKEWYDAPEDNGGRRDKGGTGISLQGNYATFDGDAQFDYVSVLLQLSMTRF